MTTHATTTQHVEQIDPRDLLVDANVRRDNRLDPEFVASVRDLGVLVPIVAVRTGDGEVRVRLGHRRTLAAIEAGQATVPVVVVGTDTEDQRAAVERIVSQHAENHHRAGLTLTEEVGVIAGLADLGVSAAQIAKRTKIKRDRVDAALTVARSPLAQDAAETYGHLDLTQAAVLAEFTDDAEAVKALVTAAQRPGMFEHAAQTARDERNRTQRRKDLAASLAAEGVRVVDDVPRTNWVDRLVNDDHVDLTPEGHAGCPGHAATVATVWGWVDPATGEPSEAGVEVYDDEDQEDDQIGDDLDALDDEDDFQPATAWGSHPAAVWVCTDPAAYGYHGRYESRETLRPKLAEMTEAGAKAARAQRRDVIASNKAWASAEPVRREYLRALLTRKTPPKGSAALVASALARDADTVAQVGGNHLAADLLGCDPTTWGRNGAVADLITQATDARAQVLGLALVLAAYEDNLTPAAWRRVQPTTQRYLGFVSDTGYTLADIERRACGQDPLADMPADPPAGP